MNSFITWSPAVREVIGAERLATLCRDANEYVCVRCDKPGKATREPTNVIVNVGPGSLVVRLAHARCAASQIVHVDQPLTASPGGEDVVCRQLKWQLPSGLLAGLLIDHSGGLVGVHPTGDLEDPWTQALLEQGWQLIVDSEQPCQPISTGVLELNVQGKGRLMIDAPYGSRLPLLDQLPEFDPDWTQAALTRGFLKVWAGTVGMSDDYTQFGNEVDAAVRRGHLVGALVPVAQIV
ncbi:hypothetical protein [Mycobacterium servetii]|uniref:Uncharacterized protein n=1 Tax=Mycobacterium servetii TaxID=3237418 RepID=A0ABV4C9S3_9MYCO